MIRVFGGLLVGLIALFGIAQPVQASVDDFRFSSFEADYYLGSDSEGRSTLKTVERLTAEFPNFDQNHGIERAIPKEYDGHTTSLKIISVTDAAGKAVNYSTYESNNNIVLRLGDKDKYVRGTQGYIITYTQRDVTKSFNDTERSEFYWDTNGTMWQQPFGRVTARVHVAGSLAPMLTDDIACYWGTDGSTRRCDIQRSGDIVLASVENLRPQENMTVALGFTLGTFRAYEPSLLDRLIMWWGFILFATSLIGFIMIFWLSIRYGRASNRNKDMGSIAAEYTPPKGASILVSSHIGDGTKADTTAQLIDLAVRHYVTISQTKKKSLWHQAEYELEIVKPVQGLYDEEKRFLKTVFGSTAVGTKLQTKTLKNNYSLSSKLVKNGQELTKAIKNNYGYREADKAASKPFRRTGLALLAVGLLTLSPLMLIAALIAYICAWQLKPLTEKGLDLRRYLAGLKMYIEAAEKDRIAMLQSPEAVEKIGKITGNGDKKLLRLYERTLPYAVLFGQEKEWNKQLAVQYENTDSSPTWYAGQSAFNATVFTSAMNDFSGSMNSYGASSSSSSGSSSGGGSSGGGGGGGGGGGW